jgi:Ankyrin repeats (many copies)
MDDLNRNSVHFAAAHGNQESLELLTAADALIHHTDKLHRTPMHYAALNDNSKLIQMLFVAFKTQNKHLQVYGQQEEDGNSPMKHPPKPTFTPYKGVFDHMPPLKKSTNKKPAPVVEETKKDDLFYKSSSESEGEDAGLVIEHDDDNQQEEEFKVENADGTTTVQEKMALFLTKKALGGE